jgi:hypothetical protein
MLGAADRVRRTRRAAIDAVAVSWTIGSEEDGPCAVPVSARVSHLDLRVPKVRGPACVPGPSAVPYSPVSSSGSVLMAAWMTLRRIVSTDALRMSYSLDRRSTSSPSRSVSSSAVSSSGLAHVRHHQRNPPDRP